MVTLRTMRRNELATALAMQMQSHAREFILPTTLEQHLANFEDPEQIYLAIETPREEMAGYFMLHLPTDSSQVEFRRIVVDAVHRGIGQQAIGMMEAYCREVLGCERIWLDVFEDNVRGIHIYEKRGYVFDRVETFQGRQLRFYSKAL